MPPLLLVSLLAASPAPAAAPAVHWVTEAAVRPLFGDEPLRAAKAAFDAGRWDEAARGFAGSPLPGARLLRAMALARAGRGAEAAQALAGLEKSLPAVADRVAFLAGRALEAAGDARGAAAAYGRVPATSLEFPEARLQQARVLAGLGERSAALSALGPVLGRPPPAEPWRADSAAAALLLAGQLCAAEGHEAGAGAARGHLLECWAGHPLAPESKDCLARLRELPAQAGSPPGDDEVVRRAEILLDQNHNGSARQELARIGPRLARAGVADPLACRGRLILGRAYRKDRAYARALETLRPVAARCQDPGVRARALYVVASAAAAAGLGEAPGDYLSMARAFPDHPLADDALFFGADLLARSGRMAEARRALADLLQHHASGDFRAEALFRSAWLAWRQGDRQAAAATLERMESEYHESDAYEHARASYWRARILASGAGGKDLEQARAIWADLAWRHPTDYYGLLARARLAEGRGKPPGAEPVPLPPSSDGFRLRPGPLASDPHLQAGILLLRLGLQGEAAAELAAVDRRGMVNGAEAGWEPLLLVAELLDRASDHRSAHNLLRTIGRNAMRQRPDPVNARLWRIAYPPAFRAEVEIWAPRAGVPVELVQAIMREESALDPTVVSAAGAVGLTQLMPPTARELARRLRLPPPSAADLTNPALNIRLGALHLGDLLRRFGGATPLAVAAYNAGDAPVRGWLKTRGNLPVDEFVEEIPLQETRGYVKRVLRSYAAYGFLYAGGKASLRLSERLPVPR
jgi:soluble lytic murein transglycosylase